MKKIFSILLIISLLFSMCACTASDLNYDDEIIQTSNSMLEEWGLEEGRTFSVTIDEQDIYHIDIDGYELLVKMESDLNERRQKTNTEEYNSEVIGTAKEKVINYINNSGVLRDKEELVEYINNLSFKTADFSDGEEAAAEYDLEEDVVFINNQYLDLVSEWMLVHELVHALCQKTNGGADNLRYSYDLFNEVLTDIITAAINPKISSEAISGYTEYYQWGYLYLGCVGIDGIEAYFYGYDEILSYISEEELDIFVESIEQIDSAENAIVIVCNCINDWGLEKAS